MTASELRIGNFVEVHCNCDCHKPGEIIMHFTPCCDKPVDVISILGVVENPNLTGVGVLGKERLHKIEAVYPIPITEEWLKKLGFFEHKSTESLRRFIAPIAGSPSLGVIDLDGTDIAIIEFNSTWAFSSDGSQLKYVHQLQNLYFALVGEELGLLHEPTNSQPNNQGE